MNINFKFHTYYTCHIEKCMKLKADIHNSLSPTQVNDLSWADMEQKLENTLKLE